MKHLIKYLYGMDMVFSSRKNSISSIIIGLLFISIISVTLSVKAQDLVTASLENLPEKEIRRESDRTKFKNVVVNYKGFSQKTLIVVKGKPSSIVFSKAVMCAGNVYPTVMVKRIFEDTEKASNYENALFIYNESLKELSEHYESTLISNEYTDSPDKFSVEIQPKFTLENVEAFVCSSQVNICDQGDSLKMQCTFNDGRQANICHKSGVLYPNYFRLGKVNQLEQDFKLSFNSHEDGLFSKVNEEPNNSLSGVSTSIVFKENGLEYSTNPEARDYSFENHWSARSRDDYDFHAEFNIRKDGKIIESHRCLEHDFNTAY